MDTIFYSRSLFLPGPLPPSTHLGVTLQRHCVLSGLRYTLYHLGFHLPERSPVKIHQLRLYLDVEALEDSLEDAPGAEEIVGALVDPGGSLRADQQTGEVAAAALFHRMRLLAVRHRRPPRLAEPTDAAMAWKLFRSGASRWLNLLNDAFLTDTMVARSRRRRRSEGKETLQTLPREAWRFRAGRNCKLECLGSPDLSAASWSEDRERRDQARGVLEEEPLPVRDGRRGLFRETYRDMLSHLRPAYLALAEDAHDRGLLEEPGDAFFIPFDLASDLAGRRRPPWIEEAVASNRTELESYQKTTCPADQLDAPPKVVAGLRSEPEQAWSCALPID